MNNICADVCLNYFEVERYHYESDYTFDASCCPRPHFCMGFLLRGKAHFKDCINGGEFDIYPGEIVFVPVTNRYVSNWMCDPDICYISIHFLFDHPGIFSRHKCFKLQKIVPQNVAEMQNTFEKMLENFGGADDARLMMISSFFALLGNVLPGLETAGKPNTDERIMGAVEYIEKHFSESISVEQLALASNMSVSRFFPRFKSQMGVTPVDYINHYRVSRAISLLVNDADITIEQISSMVGFETSAYFRTVFKKITGKTPKHYRGLSAEI